MLHNRASVGYLACGLRFAFGTAGFVYVSPVSFASPAVASGHSVDVSCSGEPLRASVRVVS